MVTAISRFRVRDGQKCEVLEISRARARLVENAAGFRGVDILSDASDPLAFLLLTRWTDEASFQAWKESLPPESNVQNLSDTVLLPESLLPENRQRGRESQVQNEILKLTNDLTGMIREGERTNRELKEANEKVEKLARIDPLTGLANRRTLQEAMLREIARAGRLGEHLSLVIADLDHFKTINDRYGHPMGDQVLAEAAAVFGNHLRPYDLAARYGGEEFVLLLPATSTEGAMVVAERMRKTAAAITFPDCPQQITMSLGVATWIAGETPEQFVARADAALYAAKNAGRNRVEAAAAVTMFK
jgi:diguanylate cyclase (GGDEF)-like protein